MRSLIKNTSACDPLERDIMHSVKLGDRSITFIKRQDEKTWVFNTTWLTHYTPASIDYWCSLSTCWASSTCSHTYTPQTTQSCQLCHITGQRVLSQPHCPQRGPTKPSLPDWPQRKVLDQSMSFKMNSDMWLLIQSRVHCVPLKMKHLSITQGQTQTECCDYYITALHTRNALRLKYKIRGGPLFKGCCSK